MVNKISKTNPQPVHFFRKNLGYLLGKFAINQDQLGIFINRRQTTVSNWVNGISVPDVDDLVKLHHFFGLGIDMLIMVDLEKSQLVTDKYVAAFKKLYKTGEETVATQFMQEGDPVYTRAVLDQLKEMDGKLDELRGMAKLLVGRGKK